MSAWTPSAAAPSSSGRRPAAAGPPPLPPRHRRGGRRALAAPAAALLPEHLDALAGGLSHLLTLAYEPVVLPCSALNCGDIVHRRWVLPAAARDPAGWGAPGAGAAARPLRAAALQSTVWPQDSKAELAPAGRRPPRRPPHLYPPRRQRVTHAPRRRPPHRAAPPPPRPPFSNLPCSTLDFAARGEERGLDPRGLALVAAALLYLVQRPGPLQGAVDTYIKAPLQRRAAKVYAKVCAVAGHCWVGARRRVPAARCRSAFWRSGLQGGGSARAARARARRAPPARTQHACLALAETQHAPPAETRHVPNTRGKLASCLSACMFLPLPFAPTGGPGHGAQAGLGRVWHRLPRQPA